MSFCPKNVVCRTSFCPNGSSYVLHVNGSSCVSFLRPSGCKDDAVKAVLFSLSLPILPPLPSPPPIPLLVKAVLFFPYPCQFFLPFHPTSHSFAYPCHLFRPPPPPIPLLLTRSSYALFLHYLGRENDVLVFDILLNLSNWNNTFFFVKANSSAPTFFPLHLSGSLCASFFQPLGFGLQKERADLW